jgi:hypothetical protein
VRMCYVRLRDSQHHFVCTHVHTHTERERERERESLYRAFWIVGVAVFFLFLFRDLKRQGTHFFSSKANNTYTTDTIRRTGHGPLAFAMRDKTIFKDIRRRRRMFRDH